ncbi:GTPase-activator protein for Ras-like GTPase [Phytophthora infestans]|uniref:GTPase-activator protein for Ras-like GTPase n=1 Tax=Phytophthora infestans TaxID=4787 RepID=A0A8S9TL10_PHYIN|nr:GTPase-activator protein for Ras-like GTPase [Phytophthora infestans]
MQVAVCFNMKQKKSTTTSPRPAAPDFTAAARYDWTMGKWGLQRRRSHGELPRLHELERAVQTEIEDIRGREELFLRSTSELTSLMKKLGRTQGRAYFRYVLRDVFGEKSKVYEARGPPSTKQVCAYAKSVIQRLAKAIHFAPLVLRAGCHYMLAEFRKAFPGCKHDARIVVGSLLFLRILCPALIKPEMFDFPEHTAQSLPMGVQIAKILQHTLTGTPVGDSDPAFNDSNAFIYAFQPYVASFLVRFPQIRAAFGTEEPQQMPEVRATASWDCSNVAITPTTPKGADSWAASPRAESWNTHHRPNGKMRGFSMSSNDAMKNKKKFSLRFWSRGPGGDNGSVTQGPTP